MPTCSDTIELNHHLRAYGDNQEKAVAIHEGSAKGLSEYMVERPNDDETSNCGMIFYWFVRQYLCCTMLLG